MTNGIELSDAQLERLADLVAERVADLVLAVTHNDRPEPTKLIDAAAVAVMLGITRDAVYRRADELGVTRIGSGAKARLRFDPEKVAAALAACPVRRESRSSDRPRGRRSRPTKPTIDGRRFPLLPVRGV